MGDTIHQKTTKQKVLIILTLAIPAIIENILQTLVGFVDTLFVSKLGLNEVTAVGVANTIIAVYIAIFLAIGVGASSLIARSVGAGDLEKAKAVAKQSTWISIAVGLLFGIISYFFAEPLLKVMGAEQQVMDHAIIYFRIVAVPSIFISLMTVFGSVLRAAGDTKTPMKVSLWINVIHIALDYILIFGILGFTGLGVAGAAFATVLVRIIGTIALYRYIQKSDISFSLFKNTTEETKQYISPLLKLATPTAIERLIMRLGQVLYFGLIVHIGTETFAAHSIAGSIESFSYMPGYGLAIAATTLVGQSIGANQFKDAYQYGMLTTGIGIVIMSIGGLFLFFLSPWFASWFTNEQTAIDMVVTALRIDAFAQPALAVGLILAGALQGMGDTKSPMYSTAIGMWVIRIVGVYILGIHLEMGIAGVWLSIAIDLFVRAIFLFFKFNSHFKKINN
ncbi:multidrug transporter MatE [Ureibacillus manganicus DSM 26584]|uniref:Probable multidrug resistance protein NorM n=1 Tax=Ureibacillus manganicus DSM 26584 TaxID=1384049 RepID=A0A0A3HVJ0_9BACL|nr:MATE family efflux transporter [Ureibacillus manganicus]KGR74298.1 multidrug transporter MatE [Ureibacillus manganicus DSM 26584]